MTVTANELLEERKAIEHLLNVWCMLRQIIHNYYH
jgi:hypothetical protein